MAHHSDTTVSEPPLSPFSNRSLLSDGTQTSDEPADLGAFNSVFRVMNQFQQQQHQTILVRPRPDSRATTSTSEYESDVGESSTVWSQHPIASYLNRDETNESVHSVSTSNSPEAISEDEDEEEGSDTSGTEGLLEDDLDDGISPSLGYLDSALGFLAAEKAKLALPVPLLDGRSTSHSSTGESAWRHVIEPKRKRRRKRKGPATLSRTLEQDEEIPAGARTATVVPTPEASSSSPDLSSSPDKDSRSPPSRAAAQPTSKPRRSKTRHQPQPQSQSQQHVYIPSSAPIPIPRSLPTPPDPRLLRLRALAKKLRHDFPQNDTRLAQVLVNDTSENDLVDPRGPEPQMGDALTHVFIDHSNILIGFLNHAKRSRRSTPGKPLMSFAALALILERGRPISRRVLATSSPLYQNMDVAEDIGYNVHVYVRVPDFSGDAANGTTNNNNNNSNPNLNAGSSPLNGRNMKARKPPPVVQTNSMPAVPVRNSTESDPGQLPSPSTSLSRPNARPFSHSRSISATTASTSPSSASTLAAANAAATGRIRYREQGVDELLQLKLHQALVSPDADPPPQGATIVLATGDGASGQFNEDGFVGVVRTALNKGWMVELYAWGGGISGAWRKVAEDEGRGKLRIWEMDPYVSDLLDVGGAS